MLSPRKHFFLLGTPTPGVKLTCPQSSKSTAGRAWPAGPTFLLQAPSAPHELLLPGEVAWLQPERASLTHCHGPWTNHSWRLGALAAGWTPSAGTGSEQAASGCG